MSQVYESTNDQLGMQWWNSQPESVRRLWLERSGSARPVDAWRAYCRHRAIAAKSK